LICRFDPTDLRYDLHQTCNGWWVISSYHLFYGDEDGHGLPKPPFAATERADERIFGMPTVATPYYLPADARLERPPGALPLRHLADKCIGCGDCVAVCPGFALLLDGAGLPYLVDAASCGECGLCADVCVHGGILLTDRTGPGLAATKRKERMADLAEAQVRPRRKPLLATERVVQGGGRTLPFDRYEKAKGTVEPQFPGPSAASPMS
jgi:ferredoxin